jgi:ATP-dependent 26S proteasome regulatory subunit
MTLAPSRPVDPATHGEVEHVAGTRGRAPGDGADGPGQSGPDPDLLAQVRHLEDEVAVLRRRLSDSPRQVRALEERLNETQQTLAGSTGQNDRLVATLREARDQIVALKEEVDRLALPPSGYGVFLARHEDDTVDVFTGGRKLRVTVSPAVELDELVRGQEVMLNEAMNVVLALAFVEQGEVVQLKELLDGPDGERSRALVIGHTDEEKVVVLAEPLRTAPLKPGDSLLLEPRSGYVFERIPKSEVEELVLEEVPDIDYSDIGGLAGQIEQIRDAVELPFLHKDLFKEHQLRPPKGVLLYGPPGCGKTLIAKAVANSLAKKVAEVTGKPDGRAYFLNIKGPELLNKYVGETERHIRLVFQRARETASEGTPVIVFCREHHRAADAQRDRRRRDPRERRRHRRLEPRGHDRPGDPAPGSARREDQDRAPRRRGRPRHLLQVHPHRPAAARRRPRRTRRLARGDGAGDDPARRRADLHRGRGEPLPRGHLRQR